MIHEVFGAVDVAAHILITVAPREIAVSGLIPTVPIIERNGSLIRALWIGRVAFHEERLTGPKIISSVLNEHFRIARSNGHPGGRVVIDR
jgi:hypothetical protein